ncbi:MAG: glycosyltransferase [Lachnospiraceae bacterium]|nr:glycosyltransferase [Lachnospiraceae bacterium]
MDKTDKILVVGNTKHPIYVLAFYNAFVQLGYEAVEVFNSSIITDYEKKGKTMSIGVKIQNKYNVGPLVRKKNLELVNKCIDMRPNLVFLYQGINIFPSTIRRIKQETGAVVFSYNNDDPFAMFYPFYHWRHYKRSLKVCDYNFVYRQKNVQDIKAKYGIETEIIRSYYLDDKNYPILEEEKIKTPEVIFLGHYEDDERGEYIKALLEKGLKVGVPSEHFKRFQTLGEGIVSLSNERRDYNKYLASCKIPLIFLSKINHDTYTRRCFEIPAAEAFILSPYTEDMSSMYEENKEAVYYRDKVDFVNKVFYYLEHNEDREKIARQGRERLLKDGHEVKDRVKQIIQKYDELKSED